MILNCSQLFSFSSNRFILFGRRRLLLTSCSEIQCTGFAYFNVSVFENDIPVALYPFLRCVYMGVVIVYLVYIWMCALIILSNGILFSLPPFWGFALIEDSTTKILFRYIYNFFYAFPIKKPDRVLTTNIWSGSVFLVHTPY